MNTLLHYYYTDLTTKLWINALLSLDYLLHFFYMDRFHVALGSNEYLVNVLRVVLS